MGVQFTRTYLVNDTTNLDFENRIDTTRIDADLRATIQDLTRLAPRPFSDDKTNWVADIPNIILRLPSAEHIMFGQRQSITIGRSDKAYEVNPTLDLGRFDGSKFGVSRCHAKLVYINDKYHIIDLNSTNGTRINDQKITPHTTVPIYQNDKISLGNYEIYVDYIQAKEANHIDPII